MLGKPPQRLVGLRVAVDDPKLGIKRRTIVCQRSFTLELKNGQPYLENQVRIPRRGYQFIAPPGFHGRIKLVVCALWPAAVRRFLIVRFISAAIGDKDLPRCEDLRRDWRGIRGLFLLCGTNAAGQQWHRQTETNDGCFEMLRHYSPRRGTTSRIEASSSTNLSRVRSVTV